MALMTFTAGNAIEGAAIMLAFGLGTLPAMLSSTLLAGALPKLSQRPWFRQLAGTAMLAFGVWMIVVGSMPQIHSAHVH